MTTDRHPYADIPDRAHWMRAVAGQDPLDVTGWYRRKFPLADGRVATVGSCFAQHLGRRLKQAGFDYLDAEPAPGVLRSDEAKRDFGYGLFSARYGNVYTSRQLLQLFQRAFGEFEPEEDHWRKGDGVVDPFRPTIEPEPFSSVDELRRSRAHHLGCVRSVFEQAEVFIVTLGLTECFASRHDDAVYPVAPGVAGGTWDPARYEHHQFDVPAVMHDLLTFFRSARRVKPKQRFLLTVSPVPLMATATNQHVAVATAYAKATLRAAAGALAQAHPFVDYFPAYEIITSPFMRGQFFESDGREVAIAGVDHVMRTFFAAHKAPDGTDGEKRPWREKRDREARDREARDAQAAAREATVCDEELLRGPAR